METIGTLSCEDRINDLSMGQYFHPLLVVCGKYDLDLFFGLWSCKFVKKHAPDPFELEVEKLRLLSIVIASDSPTFTWTCCLVLARRGE